MAGAKNDALKADNAVAKRAAGPPPNQTLYCNNLPDKLAKKDLKRELYLLFATHGTVLDVVAMKTSKMRGQAHIVYQDIQKSTQAMRSLQGAEFHGKKMSIQFAKGKSNFVAKLDGTFNQPSAAQQSAAAQPTSLQQSIFNNPPSSLPPPPGQNGMDGASPASVDSTKRKLDEPDAGDAKRTKLEQQQEPEEEEDDEAEMEMDESD